jgi:hypothetical protein
MKTGSKKGSVLVRLAGFLLVAGVGLFLIGNEVIEKRTERKVRAMLLTVQEALQRYHVDEELYPSRMMSGTELVKFLSEHSFLDPAIQNPWTGVPYGESEGDVQSDFLRYRTDGLAETYELIVTFPDSDEVQFQLDSTEHQSLE